MKKMICIAALSLAAALGLASCSAAVPETIKVETAENRLITVSATEKVKVVPDIAEIVYYVTTQAEDAETCQSRNAESVAGVVNTLKELGVEEKSIQTSRFSLSPEYNWSESQKVLTGYAMSTTITVTGLPIDLVGTLLSKSVESGVNEIESVTYKSSQYDEAYQQALKLAIESARTKAEAMASASGCTLGPVTSVDEVKDSQQGRYTANNMSADMISAGAGESASVQPGELEVTAQVNVAYSIQ